MIYRSIGHTPLQLSAITFGAWAAGGWMWGGSDAGAAIDAMKASYDAGVTSFDTAPAYGQGLSEELVGKALRGIPRDKVQIVTKYGLRWDMTKGTFYFSSRGNDGRQVDMYRYAGKESVIEECENSLQRLKTDYIDLYQIHWSDKTTPIGETMEAVAQLIAQGKVRYAGVCNFTMDKMAEAEKTVPLASNQIPFSMIDRRVEKETVPYCIEHHKGVLAYSPLQRGLLTGKIKPGHVFKEGDSRSTDKFFTDQSIRSVEKLLDSMKPIAAEKKATVSQLVIRWTIEQPGITIALVGARDTRQALENAKAADIQLTPEEIQFFNTQLRLFQSEMNNVG